MQTERRAVGAIEFGQRLHHFQGGVQRPFRIVFVRHRRAEKRHDFVADKFVDRAIVFLHDRNELIEAGVDELADLFRVLLFCESGETGDIGENNGHQLSFVSVFAAAAASSRASCWRKAVIAESTTASPSTGRCASRPAMAAEIRSSSS